MALFAEFVVGKLDQDINRRAEAAVAACILEFSSSAGCGSPAKRLRWLGGCNISGNAAERMQADLINMIDVEFNFALAGQLAKSAAGIGGRLPCKRFALYFNRLTMKLAGGGDADGQEELAWERSIRRPSFAAALSVAIVGGNGGVCLIGSLFARSCVEEAAAALAKTATKR